MMMIAHSEALQVLFFYSGADFSVFRLARARLLTVKVKFCKFHLDQLRDVGLRPLNFENLDFYKYNYPYWAIIFVKICAIFL